MNNLPPFFIRRYDSHKLEKVMKRGAIHAYFDTRNKEDFKIELARTAVETFFYMKHECNLVAEILFSAYIDIWWHKILLEVSELIFMFVLFPRHPSPSVGKKKIRITTLKIGKMKRENSNVK